MYFNIQATYVNGKVSKLKLKYFYNSKFAQQLNSFIVGQKIFKMQFEQSLYIKWFWLN